MSFPRAKITRFNETARCGPGVGAYTPVQMEPRRAVTFEKTQRFKGSNESIGSSCGSKFKVPRPTIHMPRDMLHSKMTELLQQLKDRDQLIAQLRLSKDKLTTHIGQLQGMLCNMQTEAQETLGDVKNATHAKLSGLPGATAKEVSEGIFLEEAGDCIKEIRLSKGTEELEAEVFKMMEGLQGDQDTVATGQNQNNPGRTEASAGSSQEMLRQLPSLSKEPLLLQHEKGDIQGHQKHLVEHASTWQREQTTAVQQHTELANRDDAKRTMSELRDMLNPKDKQRSELEGMLLHEVAMRVEDSSINLQLEQLQTFKTKLSGSETEDRLISQAEELKTQVAQLQIEGEKLKKQVSLCNDTADSLFTEKSRLKNEVDILNHHKLVLEERIDELVGQKQHFDDKLAFEKDRADLALQTVQESQDKQVSSLLDQHAAVASGLQAVQTSNETFKSELVNESDALSQLQAYQMASQEALKDTRDKQVGTSELESALDELGSLQFKHSTLADAYQNQLNCLDKTSSDLAALQECYATATCELEAVVASNAALEVQLADRSEALSQLQLSHSETVLALKEARDKQGDTAAKLEIALDELQSLKFQHASLVEVNQGQSLLKRAIEICLEEKKSELRILQNNYASAMIKLEAAEVSNSALEDQLANTLQALSELQASQGETLQVLQGAQDKQITTVAKLRGALDELQSLKVEHAKLADLNQSLTLYKLAIESSLSETKSELSLLQDNHAAVTSELKTAQANNVDLQGQLVNKLDLISELQVSQEGNLKALQDAQEKQTDAARKLESSLYELRCLQAEHATLAEVHKNLSATSDLMAEAIVGQEKRVMKYVIVSQRLEKENIELRGDLRGITDEAWQTLSSIKELWTDMKLRLSSAESLQCSLSSQWDFVLRELTEMQRRFEDLAKETERWRSNYELLLARVAPFQEQLELYEMEKNLLKHKNQATELQLSELNKKFSQIIGHQNHKQKIHYLSKIMDERKQCKEENYQLREQNDKQTKHIQKLEVEVARLCRKSMLRNQSKENIKP